MTDLRPLIERVAKCEGWRAGDLASWYIGQAAAYEPMAVDFDGELTADGTLLLLDKLLRAGWRVAFYCDSTHPFELVNRFSTTGVNAPTLREAVLLAYLAAFEKVL